MQHLDDALIAEWVDGAVDEDSPTYQAIAAHVAECDACQVRVEEERALARHVRGLLGQAAPPERVPPFEEVLHRAHHPARRASPPVWRRLAWAATVALAGGVGWYARGVLMEANAPPEPLAPPLAQVALEPEAGAAQPAAASPSVPAATTERPVPTSTTPPPPAEEMAPERAAEVTAADVVADERRQAVSTESTRQDAPTPRTEVAARLARAAPSALGSVAEKSEAGEWLVVTPDVARTTLGRAPLTVPGLRVVLLERSTVGSVVRVTQDLGDGALIRLVESTEQAPATPTDALREADAASGRGAGAAATETTMRDGVRITGLAPVAADSLRVLLEKLR